MTTMIPAWVNGKLTPVEKLEVHQRGLRHKAISVFVMRGRETLIQRRAGPSPLLCLSDAGFRLASPIPMNRDST